MQELKSIKEINHVLDNPETPRVLLFFIKNNCGPCTTAKPQVVSMIQSFPHVKFCTINVDHVPDTLDEFGITGLPTFQLFDRGILIYQILGFQKAKLSHILK